MKEFYDKHYKKLIIIHIVFVLLSLFVIFNQYNTTGDIITKDISLQGGLSVEVYSPKPIDIDLLKEDLQEKFPKSEIFIRKLSEFTGEVQNGVIIESTNLKEEELKQEIEEVLDEKLIEQKNYFAKETSSSLGNSFYKQMLIAILLAFLFMGIVVLITFRTIIPSLAVVFAALSNMIITIAVINLIGIRVSDAAIAALLLMIGYSIDTDVLLTTRVIKREEGTIYERTKGAVKTGLTMTGTTLSAITAGFIVTNSFILKQMFLVLIIGLIIDLSSTYLMNASILNWYVKSKLKK